MHTKEISFATLPLPCKQPPLPSGFLSVCAVVVPAWTQLSSTRNSLSIITRLWYILPLLYFVGESDCELSEVRQY